MKKNNSKKRSKLNKKSKASIFLYLIAILFLGYTAYSVYDTYNYVNQLVSYGSIDITTQMSEVISYYVSTSAPFAFYALVSWAMGYVISKINIIINHLIPTSNEVETDISEEENK